MTYNPQWRKGFSFGTVAVSGQDNIVAEADPDTLTVVAGTNVTLTTDATTDALTINASGGSGITELTGDVTASGTGSVAATIANDAVTYAKMQNTGAGNVVLTRSAAGAGNIGETALAAGELLGRGSTGNVAAITLGANLTMTGTTLAATSGGGPASQLDANGTTLDVDAIADGEYLRRVGTTVVGATPSSGGDASFLFGAITTTTNNATASWTAVTGSPVTVEAGKTYAIRWRLRTYSAAATTGLRLRRVLAGGAVGTVLGWHALVMNNATAMNGRASREGTVDDTTGASLGNATSSTTASGTHWVDCLFTCTTGGTIGLEMQTEVNTSLATIDGDGSYWEAVVRTT